MTKKAFTLSEVMLTLTIIGIIAAILLPGLINDIYDRVWKTKRATLLTRISNAVSTMDKIDGYGKLSDSFKEENEIDETEVASLDFVTNGLSKVYKIKNICSPSAIETCLKDYSFLDLSGYRRTIPTVTKDAIAMYNINNNGSLKPTKFDTINGEQIVLYYNPDCAPFNPKKIGSSQNTNILCANLIFDLNGSGKPNQLGKDVGVISIMKGYNDNIEVVSPPYFPELMSSAYNYNNVDYKQAIEYCKSLGEEYYIPEFFEAYSFAINKFLYNRMTSTFHSSSFYDVLTTIRPKGTYYYYYVYDRLEPNSTLCFKH